MHRLLVALVPVLVAGCSMGSVSDVAGPTTEDGEHAWVYFPRTEVYHCARHDHGFRFASGHWVGTERVDPFDHDGRSYLIDERGERPWDGYAAHRARFSGEPSPMELASSDANGHSWVHYPESQVFACQRHNHSYRSEGGRWVESDLKSRLGSAGMGYQLGYCGPEPYVHALLEVAQEPPIE